MFFRETVASRGRFLTGNVGDTRLCIVILEHWIAVIRGDVPFRSPIFFWPEVGVLGYTECLALFLPPYAFARALGSDRYLAFQATLIALKAVGYAAMYLLLRQTVRVGPWLAMLGAALFTISNASYLGAAHSQLLSVTLVPVVWLLGWRWAMGRPPRSSAPLMASSVLLAVLLFTSFYIGWFTLFVSVLAGTVVLALAAASEPRAVAWRRVRAVIRDDVATMALAAVVFVMAAGPFLAVYLPSLRSVGGRQFSEVAAYLPEPRHVVDVGPGNLVWGSLLRTAVSHGFLSPFELQRGWPPLLLLVFLITVVVAASRRQSSEPRGGDIPDLGALVLALGITVILAWMLTCRFGDVAPWRVVWALVPGGVAIRVPVRIAHVLNVLVIAVAMAGLAAFLRSSSQRIGGPPPGRTIAAIVLAAMLLAEQLNGRSIAEINRPVERAKFARIGPPPRDCRQFYVLRAPTTEILSTAEAQIDAMLVAYEYLVPTLNGWSGNTPPEWDLHPFDGEASVRARARAWARLRGVASHLCTLDLATGAWSRDDPSGP